MSTEKKIELINPQRKPLTPEKLRELSGLNLSDEQAAEVIWSLSRFAQIIYEFIARQEKSVECENRSELG
jgi:hypothetical protein